MRLKDAILFTTALMFMGAAAHLSAGSTASGDDGWKTYSHPQLSFSLRYPPDLKAEEFPDGVMLVHDTLPRSDENPYQVTNQAFWPNSAERGTELFGLFRDAKAGAELKRVDGRIGVFRKVEDLVVDGHPAVKMIYEYQPSGTPQRPDVGRPMPPAYYTYVYIKKSGAVWAITSFASDRKTQEQRARTFERIVSTFRFS